MPLNFPGQWRFEPPILEGGAPAKIERRALGEFQALVAKAASQGDRYRILELFKTYFYGPTGRAYSRSTTADWAESDLHSAMWDAADNAPVFLESFYDACQGLEKAGLAAPSLAFINKTCAENKIPFRLDPPDLRLDGGAPAVVKVVARPESITDKARAALDSSLRRAEELLVEGRGLEAVREVIWLLESISTAFRGMEIEGHVVEGKYFNDIATDLRKAGKDKTLGVAIRWAESLQAYLSSPTGGGVRHGRAFDETQPMTVSEARYFVNLTLSHLNFLLTEHERVSSEATASG